MNSVELGSRHGLVLEGSVGARDADVSEGELIAKAWLSTL